MDGDEPSCGDFPPYGNAVKVVERVFPNQFAYLDRYAGYGMVVSGGREDKALFPAAGQEEGAKLRIKADKVLLLLTE